MKKQVLSAAIATILGVASLSAQAALVIEGGSSQQAKAESSVSVEKKTASSADDSRHDWRHGNRVVVKEFGSGHASGYSGFGEEMSLSDSLSLIVPEGWTVRLADGVEPSSKVNWRASGDTWVEGLVGVMKDSAYSSRVFWDRRMVEVEDVPSQTPEIDTLKAEKAKKAQEAKKAEEAANRSTDKPKEKVAEKSVEPKIKKTIGSHPNVRVTEAPMSMTYMLPEGEYLSDALRNYVKKQGWKDLRWNVDHDYRLDAPVAMVGKGLVDAVTNLIITYQAQGGLQGVEPVFAKGNKIVVIRPMDMSASMSRSQ